MFAKDIRWKKHIDHVLNKANRILGMNFQKQRFLTMEKLVRCTGKTTSRVCSPNEYPHLVGDIEKLELVQRPAIKNNQGFKNLSYYERFQLNLT